MAKKVALINMKGGVGKSTLAVNLAWAMATRPWSKRVLVIDLDPQFNCSQYLLGVSRIERMISDDHPTVWNIMEQFTSVPGSPGSSFNPRKAVVTVVNYRNTSGLIDLIPSRLELSRTLRNPANKEYLLKRAVEQLEARYDLIIIDCAPTDSLLTTAAYLVAECLLIPVRPEFLSTVGLPLLEESLDQFGAQFTGERPEVLGIAFNAVSRYAPEEVTALADVSRVATRNNWPVFDEIINYSRSFPKSAREGRPIFNTSYVRTTTRQNFMRFAREFAREIGI